MSVDPPEIRRLAADPYMIATVEIIECFFESMAGQKDLDPAMAGATKEEIVEDCWRLLKLGVFRLYDEVDDDDLLIQETKTPAERARARVRGTKLFAVRRSLRPAARRRRRWRRRVRPVLQDLRTR